MERWRKALHGLALHLHKGVYEIERDMSLREFIDWLHFFEETNSETPKQEKPIDVTELSPEKLKEMFK